MTAVSRDRGPTASLTDARPAVAPSRAVSPTGEIAVAPVSPTVGRRSRQTAVRDRRSARPAVARFRRPAVARFRRPGSNPSRAVSPTGGRPVSRDRRSRGFIDRSRSRVARFRRPAVSRTRATGGRTVSPTGVAARVARFGRPPVGWSRATAGRAVSPTRVARKSWHKLPVFSKTTC